MNPLKISQSEIKTYMECRRKWYLTYYLCLQPRESEKIGHRSTGTRIHRALEGHYVPDGQPQADMRDTLQQAQDRDFDALLEQFGGHELVPDFILSDWKKAVDLERAMIDGYVEWLEQEGADEGLQIVKSEVAIEVPFPIVGIEVPVSLVGKLDVTAIRTQDGRRMFLDHKSAASITKLEESAQREIQPLYYMLLESLAYPDEQRVSGMIYNVLRKVKRTAAAKPPFYARIPVEHSSVEMASFVLRVRGVIRDIVATRAELDKQAGHHGAAYPNPTDTCSWKCQFVNVCTMFDDGSRIDDLLSDQYVVGDPHSRYETSEE